MRAAFMGFSLVLAAAASAQAPAVRNAPVQTLAAPWDIAGVRLGMTPAEVGPAMRAAGYTLEFQSKGRSWQGEVANAVLRLRSIRIPEGAKVIRMEDYRKGQESIKVQYTPGENGSHVAEVAYFTSARAVTADAFRAAAVTKYGRPTIDNGAYFVYCSARERNCSRFVEITRNELPNLLVAVSVGAGRDVRLRQGASANRGFVTAVQAEAERLYPKMGAPSI